MKYPIGILFALICLSNALPHPPCPLATTINTPSPPTVTGTESPGLINGGGRFGNSSSIPANTVGAGSSGGSSDESNGEASRQPVQARGLDNHKFTDGLDDNKIIDKVTDNVDVDIGSHIGKGVGHAITGLFDGESKDNATEADGESGYKNSSKVADGASDSKNSSNVVREKYAGVQADRTININISAGSSGTININIGGEADGAAGAKTNITQEGKPNGESAGKSTEKPAEKSKSDVGGDIGGEVGSTVGSAVGSVFGGPLGGNVGKFVGSGVGSLVGTIGGGIADVFDGDHDDDHKSDDGGAGSEKSSDHDNNDDSNSSPSCGTSTKESNPEPSQIGAPGEFPTARP